MDIEIRPNTLNYTIISDDVKPRIHHDWQASCRSDKNQGLQARWLIGDEFMHKKEFAVIGLGRFGAAAAITLQESGHHVLGIDDRDEIVQSLSSTLTHVAALDATDEEALKSINIRAFETVVVAIGTNFESNLLITVALQNLGIKNIISKAINHRQQEILQKIGATRVVLPEWDAGRRLAKELVAPTVLEQFEIGSDYTIAETMVPRVIANQPLIQSNVRAIYNVSILLVKRGDNVTTSPPGTFILLPGDLIVVIGRNADVEKFSELT